jgi:hypothetical protein
MIPLITSALSALLCEAKLPGSATYATGHRLFGGIEHCTQMLHNAFRAQNSISLPLQWSTTAAECKIVVLACKVAAYLHRITVAQGGNSSSQWQKLVLGTLGKITELIGYVLAGLETGCSALHRAVKKSLRSVDRYGIENFRPTVSIFSGRLGWSLEDPQRRSLDSEMIMSVWFEVFVTTCRSDFFYS